MLLALLACAPEPSAVPVWPRAGEQVVVEVHARHGDTETAWTARVAVNPEAPAPRRACGPEPTPPTGERAFARVSVEVPTKTDLRWVPDEGRWRAEGPRTAVDPAWAVGTVTWTLHNGTRVEAPGAARFGGPAKVRAIARDDDGSVRVYWEESEDEVSVLSAGTECVGDHSSVRVPWWAVPPEGGQVVIRTTRTRTTIVPDQGVVRVRAVLEELLPLDVPLTTRDQPAPAAPRPHDRPPRYFRTVDIFG